MGNNSYKYNFLYNNQSNMIIDDYTGRKYFNYDDIEFKGDKSKSFALNRSI